MVTEMRMIAPLGVMSLEIGSTSYEPDQDGVFELKVPEHREAAEMHGCKLFDGDQYARPFAPGLSDAAKKALEENEQLKADLAAAAVDRDEMADLREQLAAMQARLAAGAGTGGPEAAPGGVGSGDSASAPDVALPAGRDNIVKWLGARGVSLSVSSSNEVAQSALTDYVTANPDWATKPVSE